MIHGDDGNNNDNDDDDGHCNGEFFQVCHRSCTKMKISTVYIARSLIKYDLDYFSFFIFNF